LHSKWKDLTLWKAEARKQLLQHLYYDPEVLPLKSRLIQQEEREGFAIEQVMISATKAYEIPAWILIPVKRKGKLPAVNVLHCHSGRYTWGHEKCLSSPGDSPELIDFRSKTYGRAYAEELAKRGYVVMVTDAFYFGSRRLQPETINPAAVPTDANKAYASLKKVKQGSAEWLSAVNIICREFEHPVAKTLFAAGATWPGVHLWDDMRSLDYLASRPEVDSERMGCMGLSLGGFRAALLSAHPKVKATSATAWMTQFEDQLRNHTRQHTWMVFIPGLYAKMDLPDIAALLAPGSLLIQECSRDLLYPQPALHKAVEKLKTIYKKAGVPERFRGTFYDEPHCFRPHMQSEAFEWMDKWLKA
jgi:dienelactone hydrolase